MDGRSARSPLWNAAALVIVIAGLHVAAPFLVPMVTAAMLAIICSPMVRELGRRRVPRAVAVVMVVVALLLGLGLAGALVGSSVAGFREQIPGYQKRFAELVSELTAWLYNKGWISQASRLVDALEPQNLIGKGFELAGGWFTAVTELVEKALLVTLALVLILLEGETVPRRLRALSKNPLADISHFERIASDVQSYLAIKSVLSIITGALIGGWAAVLGIDFALLWGLLGFLFNYIPNIGAVIAAIPPTILALLLRGPGVALAFFGGTVAVHMLIGNLLEPMWMGRKLGLSITVVLVSLLFWGEVWGPVGMLLSVPLTMVIKILLEHSKDHRHLAALLDEGGKPPAEPVGPLGDMPAPDDSPPRASERPPEPADPVV
jgi:AI-2 transport protein TqsA